MPEPRDMTDKALLDHWNGGSQNLNDIAVRAVYREMERRSLPTPKAQRKRKQRDRSRA